MFGILALAMLAGNGVQAQQAGIGAQAQQKDLVGNWQGTLQAGNGLRLVMKVKKDDGKLRAVSYSIDQGGAQIAITSISLDGNAVSFSIEPLDVTYAGTMSADGKTISGSQTQHGQPSTLNLEGERGEYVGDPGAAQVDAGGC
jgi:hypothetical protein